VVDFVVCVGIVHCGNDTTHLGESTRLSYIALITAIATVITAMGGLIVSLFVLVPSLRVAKITHNLVNQQRTDSINYQNALIRALKDAKINVPIDQSQPNGETQAETA
jgi:hypothetical protein